MIETDFGSFERAFKRASAATQHRWKAIDDADVVRTYFRLLEGWPLELVMQAFKTCCQTLKHFPKVPELIARLEATRPLEAPRWRQMTHTESTEQARAAAIGFQDEPCRCLDCQAADVTDRPVRFVPTLDGELEERAFNPQRARVELVGHWAHGEELRRWYAARDACFAKWQRAATRYPHLVGRGIARELVGVGAEREPGEEG